MLALAKPGVATKLQANLGVVYTMDQIVVPRPCETCDWLLSLSWFTLQFTPRKKNTKVTMEFEVPKRHNIVDLHYPLNTPTGFAVGEAKEVLW